MTIKKYEFRAIVLSPLMAGPALLMTSFQYDNYLTGDWWLLLIPPLYSAMLAAPFAYAGTLAFGLPLYLILREFNLDKFWIIASSGFPIGMLVSIMFSGFDSTYATIITTSGCLVSTSAATIIFLGKPS